MYVYAVVLAISLIESIKYFVCAALHAQLVRGHLMNSKYMELDAVRCFKSLVSLV